MAKKKMHPVVQHGIRIGIPAGLGTFGGFYIALDVATEALGKITETEKSFEACMKVIETITIFR